MNTNWDEAKLTAYALGELEGEERAAIEAMLANNSEARQWVEAVRKMSGCLETELRAEASWQLTSEQAAAIRAELELRKKEATQPKWKRAEARQPERRFFQFRLIEALVALALIAVLAAVLLPALSKSKSRSMAMYEEVRPVPTADETRYQPAEPTQPPIAEPLPQPPVQSQPIPNTPQPEPAAYGPRPTVSLSSPAAPPQPEQEVAFRQRYGIGPGLADQKIAPTRFNTESYSPIADSGFLAVAENPLSTFSIDVDTASYSIVRRFLNQRQLPPTDAVRIEEMINYFTYNYPPPKDGKPFSVNVEVAGCPWNSEYRLVRIGLKGREMARDQRPPSNLVFLVDVSGSMQPANKLPLLKECLKMLVQELTEDDHVSIVVYAGAAGEVLPSTSGDNKRTILRALDKLEAGGSTHGSQGIQLAYETAEANFISRGVNRVILCTDGDFNVGITSSGDLVRLIEEKAKSGVFLTVLGFGMGNYKDATVEMLADKGNGNYAYIDSLKEGRKVLIEQMSGTLVTIAKDVKIQVEFNPAQVTAYRLIGYENRLLKKEDFNDDRKDAGDIGAGHTVTALYEVVPAGKSVNTPGVDPLKYQRPARPGAAADSDELLTLKLRYKEPDRETSKLIVTPVVDRGASYARASTDFKFASAVAAFGMILRESPYKGTATFDGVWELAMEGQGRDAEGYREDFLKLVEQAKRISPRRAR